VKGDQGIKLLIVHDSMSDAERFTSTLRNAGLPVRSERVDDVEDMVLELKENAYDLILCALDLLNFDPADAISELNRISQDVPMIGISENKSEQMLVDLMNLGLSDVVSKQHLTHLVKVVEREFHRVEASQQRFLFEKAYGETEARCNNLMESSRDAIAYISDGMHIHANRVYVSMFGFEVVEELESIPILDMIASEEHAAFKKFLRKYEKKRVSGAQYETKGRYSDGSLFEATMEFSPASIDGEPCTQLIIRDSSTNEALAAQIHELSSQDPLTHLYNRQYFLDTLNQRCQDRTGDEALIYIMMDNFKAIRDETGIASSDVAITEIAERLRDQVRDDDLLARFDDHTFILCSRNRDDKAVGALAEGIRHAIDEHTFEKSGQFIVTHCSIGISYAGENTDGGRVIQQAVHACDKASKQGGNKVVVYMPDTSDTASDEWQAHMTETLRKALKEDRLSLLFQPIVSLQGDTEENYCVLLRLQGEKGLLSPDDFLPLAKTKGLDLDIDRWVIQHAITQLSEHRKQGRNINFFVTLCGRSLTDQSLILYILDCLKQANLRADCLIFQVDDKHVRKHLQEAKTFLQGLKKIQSRFAIDNFELDDRAGSLITTLPADYIKLKGVISENLATNAEHQKIIKQASALTKEHKMSLVAKSVEDANCLAILWGSGVDYIQGFFLQEPAEALTYDFSSDDM